MAQTMQAYIANMLEMRQQNALAARFRAEQDEQNAARMSSAIASAGKGLGQVFGGGLSTQDKLANRLMQEQYTIPGAQRAQAVNPAMQGPADALRSQMYMGGMDELKMRQLMEDQTAQRAVQGSQIEARTARNEATLSQIELAGGNLAARQREIDLRVEAAERKAELNMIDKARKDFANTTEKYKGLVANAKGYTSQMAVALKALGHAKTPEQHQAAADAIQAHYQAGRGTGLEVAEPVIRPFVDELQKDAIIREEERLKAGITGATTDAWPDWLQTGMVAKERQALKGLEALKSRPGYAEAQPGYTPPEQPAGIFPVIPPAPEIPAILGGTGPNPTPSQAVGGAASGSAAPIPISAEEAFKMTGIRRAPGKRFDSGPGTQAYVVK